MEASEGRKTKTENVEFGDIVEIEYVGKLRDETIVAQAKEDDPLRFKVGAEEVIKGLDIAVIGMEIGQVKEVEIQPQDAYGGYNPKKVKKISKGSKERDLV
ncbi:MAG: peptidylprolyl isomerase, partial [Candidatus Heimdallarchaeota archaeon]